MINKFNSCIFIFSGLLFSNIATAQEGIFLHSGSMCSLAKPPQQSEKCLALGGWGASNLCNKKISIICPVIVPKGLHLGGDSRIVAVDTYGANVSAHVIWQSRESWQWKKCPPVKSIKAGFNELHPKICDAALGKRYLSIKVDLPAANTRVYGYHPSYIIE